MCDTLVHIPEQTPGTRSSRPGQPGVPPGPVSPPDFLSGQPVCWNTVSGGSGYSCNRQFSSYCERSGTFFMSYEAFVFFC